MSHVRPVTAITNTTASASRIQDADLSTAGSATQVTMTAVTVAIPSPSDAHHTHQVLMSGASKASAATPAPTSAVTPLHRVAAAKRTTISLMRLKVILSPQKWGSTHPAKSGSSVLANAKPKLADSGLPPLQLPPALTRKMTASSTGQRRASRGRLLGGRSRRTLPRRAARRRCLHLARQRSGTGGSAAQSQAPLARAAGGHLPGQCRRQLERRQPAVREFGLRVG